MIGLLTYILTYKNWYVKCNNEEVRYFEICKANLCGDRATETF